MSKKEDTSLNLNLLDEKGVYEAFNVKGNESEALTDSYFELYQLLGEEAMLKLYKHYRGDKIDCPMKLYRAEYIADLAKTATEDAFYHVCTSIVESLQEELKREDVDSIERARIEDKMIEVAKMIGEKDSESKNFKFALTLIAMLGLGFLFGGMFAVGMKKSGKNDDFDDIPIDVDSIDIDSVDIEPIDIDDDCIYDDF